jgi:tetratricopeptide (TPR) repeat protein
MRLTLPISICVAVLAAGAHGGPVYPTREETRELLTTNRFEILDQRFSDIQTAYRDGAISEVELRNAFRVFYDPDSALEKSFETWVTHSPKSYVAHLARGIYYKYVGNERRGSGFASETSAAQFEGMRAANSIAAHEFAASLPLETKPLLTYHHAIDLASDSGDHERERALLDKAIAIDPHTYIVREKFMGTLRTRWGGSPAQMRTFLAECRNAGLTGGQLKTLESLVLEDEAWVKQYRDHDEQGAITKYREASVLDSHRNCDPCGPLVRAAELSLNQQDYEGAVQLYSKALVHNPDLVSALNGRGYAHVQLGNRKLAADNFLRSAQLGDPYGQTELAKMLLSDDAPNEEEGVAWLQKAAAQGYRPAQEMLRVVRGEPAIPAAGSRPTDVRR